MSTTVGKLSVELGISDDQLRAGLAAAMVQAQQAGQKISQSMNQAGKSGPSANPQGLLNVSRAIDDIQYGFRGVINNIEGIVTGFGGSAGVAGAATIAAVAIASIVPKVVELASQMDPVKELANTLRDISNTGIAGTFSGIANSAKATQEAYDAAAKKLEEMRFISQQVIFSTSGPGAGAAGAMQDTGQSFLEISRQRRQVNQLARSAAGLAYEASQARSQTIAGGLSRFDRTTADQEQIKLNQQIFQAAVDKLGGGETVFKRLNFFRPDDATLFGKFKEGDKGATEEAVKLLQLQAEKAKILADDYERVTGSAAELRRIEEESIKAKEEAEKKAANEAKKQAEEQAKAVEDNMKNLANIFRERESLMKKEDNIRGNIEELQLQRQRTEIIGSSDVFMRNFTAGTEKDPVVNAIEKQTEDLKEVIDKLKELN